MAKRQATPKMDTPTARAKNCKPRHEPYWEVIEEGCALGYRRGKRGGVWYAKYYLPEAKPPRKQKDIGFADDSGTPAHIKTLTYAEAKEGALAWRKAEAEALAAPASETPKEPYSVRKCMADYMSSYEKAGGRASKDTLRVVNAHILPAFGDHLVEKLTRSQIQEWFEDLADSPARLRTAKSAEQRFRELPDDFEAKRRRRSTANRILTVLKAALNKALEMERVSCPNTAWRMVKPFRKADSARLRFLSVDDQKTLVDACPPYFRKLVQAALFTGARYGELSRLMHVRDFHERTGQVFVTSETKSEESRYIALSDEGIAFFKDIVEGRKKSERMFLTEKCMEWKRGHQVRPMNQAVKDAEIEDGLSFHELRHTYASTLIMAGVPLAVVAEQLGHKGTRMVDKHYGHLAKKYVTDTIRQLSPRLNLTAGSDSSEGPGHP